MNTVIFYLGMRGLFVKDKTRKLRRPFSHLMCDFRKVYTHMHPEMFHLMISSPLKHLNGRFNDYYLQMCLWFSSMTFLLQLKLYFDLANYNLNI